MTARFGLLGDGRTAVIEMAAASGLVLVPRNSAIRSSRPRAGPVSCCWRRSPQAQAPDRGHRRQRHQRRRRRARAGARVFACSTPGGRELKPGGGELGRLAQIDPSGRRPELDGVEMAVACDVTNPLCGPGWRSRPFTARRKGRPRRWSQTLDRNLAHFASIVERDLGVAISDLPGSGAAGGLGGGLVAFAGGKLSPGIELVINAVDLESRLKNADLCLTGEGAIDGQSAFGKTAVGVARLARTLRLPGAGLGRLDRPGARAVLDQGIDAYFSICPAPIELEQAIAQAALNCWSTRPNRPYAGSWRGEPTNTIIDQGISSCLDASEPTSEFGLIDWIRRRKRERPAESPWTKLGIGDDCAILDVGPRIQPAGHDRHAHGWPPLPARGGRPRACRVQGPRR